MEANMPGTTLTYTDYETGGSPQGFAEEKGTPTPLTSTVGMLTVPKDAVISNDYKLNVDLVAVVKVEDNKFLVIDYQIDEYGIGDSLQEAQQDLFDSLIDYFMSLERRDNRLGDRERLNLQALRNLLARK